MPRWNSSSITRVWLTRGFGAVGVVLLAAVPALGLSVLSPGLLSSLRNAQTVSSSESDDVDSWDPLPFDAPTTTMQLAKASDPGSPPQASGAPGSLLPLNRSMENRIQVLVAGAGTAMTDERGSGPARTSAGSFIPVGPGLAGGPPVLSPSMASITSPTASNKVSSPGNVVAGSGGGSASGGVVPLAAVGGSGGPTQAAATNPGDRQQRRQRGPNGPNTPLTSMSSNPQSGPGEPLTPLDQDLNKRKPRKPRHSPHK